MKITFNNDEQKVTATRIIRCRVKDVPIIFHVAFYPDSDEVEVYSPCDQITCYEVDEEKIEVRNGH